MSKEYPPLTYKDVIKILKNLGFELRPQKGTSHEQWVKTTDKFYKVTVDSPKAPFNKDLIKYMARQAGVSKKEFYRALEL